eukprot:GHVO01052904.1.p1 GENE.GHVO01052904.1~~GHVO01052904.1.p1  ORF type:complete len:298 (+),score=40.52 GHVO01052904.1:339-1232(+)
MVDKVSLKEAFLLGRSNNNELTPDLLKTKGWDNARILSIMNVLVDKRLGVIRKNSATGKVICRVRDEDVAQRLQTLTKEEYQVYCSVEESGNQGIWTAEIRKGTNLAAHIITKCVKQLEDTKKLIKPVRSIHVKNRKMYMLAHLEPSREIAGGTFYDDGEFNEGLVERLREQICHVVQHRQQSTMKDISNYIRSAGFGRDFADDDLKLVMRTLELEQQVQTIISPAGEMVYTWSRWPNLDPFEDLPCGTCPVFRECTNKMSMRISPQSCEYYDHYLNYGFKGAVAEDFAQDEAAEGR